MRIAIYVRKSVSGDDRSISLDAQEDLCKTYFKGENTFEVFKDRGLSGKNTDRPNFQKLTKKVSNGLFDIVVCYKFDRIARNTLDFLSTLELFKTFNTELISITEGYDASTPAGKMMVTLLASIAEMERENIKQRVIDSMNNLAHQGRYSGGPTPFGYSILKTGSGSYLKLEEGERISYIYNSFLSGKTANDLAKEFKVTSKGMKLILRNPLYMKSSELGNEFLKTIGYEVVCLEERLGSGYITYGKRGSKHSKKIAVASLHESVIDASTWIQAQERLKTFDGHATPRISNKTWLAQLVKCSCCGNNMKVRTTSSGTYLQCSNNCFNRFLNVVKLEKLIFDKLTYIDLSEDEFLDNSKEGNLKNEISIITKSINENERTIEGLISKLSIAPDSIAKRLIKTMDECEKNIEMLSNLKTQKMLILEITSPKNVFDNQEEVDKYKDFFNTLDIKGKQQSIRNIIDHVEFDGVVFCIH